MNQNNIHRHTVHTDCHIDLHIVAIVKTSLGEVPDVEGEEGHTSHTHQLPQVTHSPPQHPDTQRRGMASKERKKMELHYELCILQIQIGDMTVILYEVLMVSWQIGGHLILSNYARKQHMTSVV